VRTSLGHESTVSAGRHALQRLVHRVGLHPGDDEVRDSRVLDHRLIPRLDARSIRLAQPGVVCQGAQECTRAVDIGRRAVPERGLGLPDKIRGHAEGAGSGVVD
jgi:hypothetical protein